VESTTTTQRSFVANLSLAYEVQLVNYLHQMLGNRERASELAQESFATLVTYTPESLPFPRAALFKVATNFALIELRRRRLANAGVTDPVRPKEVPDVRGDPTRRVGADLLGEHLATVIKSLRPTLRKAFVMAHVQGMTRKQIAAALSMSEMRVDELMTNALATCRDRLSAKGIDLADMIGVLLLLHFACALGVH
jgi:RNA polymerase sigma factor (sigma-70 family)